MKLWRHLLVCSLLGLQGQMVLPVFCQNGPAEHAVQDLVTLISAYSEKSNQALLDAAAKRINYESMLELMFKPGQWSSLSAVDRRAISSEFRRLVEERYYPRWHKIFGRSKIAFAGEAKAGGDIYLKSFLTRPGEDDSDAIVWRIRTHGADATVVDVDVNGKDMIARLAPRFQKMLQKRGSSGLVAWLKDRAKEGGDAEDLAAR